jgi:hypothetical protein
MDPVEKIELERRLSNFGCAIVVAGVCLFVSCLKIDDLSKRVDNLEKSLTADDKAVKKDAK